MRIPSKVHDRTNMSSESNPSLSTEDRLIEINRENAELLMDVMVKYDEFHTLLSEVRQDTTGLRAAIRLALQTSVGLIVASNEILERKQEKM